MNVSGRLDGLRGRVARHLAPSRHPLAWAGVFLALVVIVVMWREVFAAGQLLADDIWTSDLLNNNVPPRAFIGRELRAGRFPLWLPGSYGGLPLVPQGEAALMSPFTWVLYGLFDRIRATTMTVAIHTWIAGFGMTLLARRFGARMLSATAAGVAFMLCGFLIEHLKHVNMHHAAAFLPWLVFSADRLRASPGVRTALPFGALAALQLAEGHPQVCYMSAFLLGPAFLYRMAATRHTWRAQAAGYLARVSGALVLAGVVTFLLAGAYLVAGHELYTHSERATETLDKWEFCTRFDFKWENLYTLGWAHVFGNGANATYDPRHGLFWESWLYVGMVPVFGAVLALGLGVRRAALRRWRAAGPIFGWALLSGLMFALMLGKHSSIYAAAFRVVPGMAWFRFPQRFALVLEVTVLLLAALGFDALRKAAAKRLGAGAGTLCGVLLLGATTVDLVSIMGGHFFAIPRAVVLKPPETVAALADLAPSEAWRFLPVFSSETHAESFGVARGWQKWKPYVPQWALLQPSTHLYWNLESVSGYTSMVPAEVASALGSLNAIGALSSPASYSAVRPKECAKQPVRFSGPCRATLKCRPGMATSYGAFNTRFLLSPLEMEDCPGWTLRRTVPSGDYKIGIYENDFVLPRAYVIDKVVDVPTVKAAAESLARGDVDPSHVATRVLTGPAASPPAQKGVRPAKSPPLRKAQPCTYEALVPGSRRVTCDLDAPGYLIIADTFYPGVEVHMDGRPVEPFLAHGIQMGLPIEAGRHEITARFRPRYAWLVVMGIAGWIALALLAAILLVRRAMGAPTPHWGVFARQRVRSRIDSSRFSGLPRDP